MFEQIKKDCPKGWRQFEIFWHMNNADMMTGQPFPSFVGWCLLFFDSVGIHIEIYLIYGGKKISFGYLIDQYRGCGKYNHKQFKSRPDAWKAAIPKAFEIYEKILEEK